MMNFYYDPILGLQYTYLGELFSIDLRCMPEDVKFDIEMWIKYAKEMSISILQPQTEPCIEMVGQITQYKL